MPLACQSPSLLLNRYLLSAPSKLWPVTLSPLSDVVVQITVLATQRYCSAFCLPVSFAAHPVIIAPQASSIEKRILPRPQVEYATLQKQSLMVKLCAEAYSQKPGMEYDL